MSYLYQEFAPSKLCSHAKISHLKYGGLSNAERQAGGERGRTRNLWRTGDQSLLLYGKIVSKSSTGELQSARQNGDILDNLLELLMTYYNIQTVYY